MQKNHIRHQVVFTLKHAINAPETEKFLQDAQQLLTSIEVVENFEVLKQISKKNDFDFGFSMEFADQDAYQAYNHHPVHVKFVAERWETEICRFLEIDFNSL